MDGGVDSFGACVEQNPHGCQSCTCPGTYVFPLNATGSKGLPEAKTAAPLDHLYASSGVHSAFEVGLDSAKMTGLSLLAAISSMTAWSNDLGSVDTPMRAVGLRVLTAESRSGTCSSRTTATIIANQRQRRRDVSKQFSSHHTRGRRHFGRSRGLR